MIKYRGFDMECEGRRWHIYGDSGERLTLLGFRSRERAKRFCKWASEQADDSAKKVTPNYARLLGRRAMQRMAHR